MKLSLIIKIFKCYNSNNLILERVNYCFRIRVLGRNLCVAEDKRIVLISIKFCLSQLKSYDLFDKRQQPLAKYKA